MKFLLGLLLLAGAMAETTVRPFVPARTTQDYERECMEQDGLWVPTESRCVYLLSTETEIAWMNGMTRCSVNAPTGTVGRLLRVNTNTVANFVFSKATEDTTYFVNGRLRGEDSTNIQNFWWMRDTTRFLQSVTFRPTQWTFDVNFRTETRGNCLAVVPRTTDTRRVIFPERCDETHQVFCEFVPTQFDTTTTTTFVDTPTVPRTVTTQTTYFDNDCMSRNGFWMPEENRCVWRMDNEYSWEQSMNECQNRAPMGTTGRLVMMTNNFVANWIATNSMMNQVYFVNGQGDQTTDVWNWWWMSRTGVPRWQVNFVPTGWNWNPSTTPTPGRCMAVRPMDTTGRRSMFPERCDNQRRFFCEFVVGDDSRVVPSPPVPPMPYPPVNPSVDIRQLMTECVRVNGYWIPEEYRCVFTMPQELTWDEGMNQCRTRAPYGTTGRMVTLTSDNVANYFTTRATYDNVYFVSARRQSTGTSQNNFWWMRDEVTPYAPLNYVPNGWVWGRDQTRPNEDCVAIIPGRRSFVPESCTARHQVCCEFVPTSTDSVRPVPGPVGPYPPQPYPYPGPQPQPYPYPQPQPSPYPQPQPYPYPQPQPYPYPQPQPQPYPYPQPMPAPQMEVECNRMGGYWMATEFRCVYLVQNQYSWEQAMNYCRTTAPFGTDGRLATIDKRHVADFMVSRASNSRVYFVNGRMRGTDRSMMESFWWMRDSNVPDRAINFIPQGQWVWNPNWSSTPGNCMVVSPLNSDGVRKISTEQCNNQLPFFCEFVAFGTEKVPMQPVDPSQTVVPSVPVTTECVDVKPECPKLAAQGQCTTFRSYMTVYCRLSCSTQIPSIDCVDKKKIMN